MDLYSGNNKINNDFTIFNIDYRQLIILDMIIIIFLSLIYGLYRVIKTSVICLIYFTLTLIHPDHRSCRRPAVMLIDIINKPRRRNTVHADISISNASDYNVKSRFSLSITFRYIHCNIFILCQGIVNILTLLYTQQFSAQVHIRFASKIIGKYIKKSTKHNFAR